MGRRTQILDRTFLESIGVKDVVWNEQDNNWDILKTNAKGETVKSTKYLNVTKHEFGKDMVYELTCFYIKNKDGHYYYSATVDAVAYAWHVGPRPIGYDIDHIDGDTNNHRLENLQCITHKENIRKRFRMANQWKH